MSSYQRPASTTGPSWLSMFSATLAALLIAGLVFGLATRAYLHWSISDTAKQIGSTHR
jgi:hypothetical protein